MKQQGSNMKYLKTNKQLREELSQIKEMLAEERAEAIDLAADYKDLLEMSTAEAVVTQSVEEGITWYDIKSKSREEQRTYYQEAQAFLKSKFVNNTVKKCIADLASEIAMSAEDFNEVQNLRYTITGLKLLIDKARETEDPDAIPEATQDDIHNAI